MFGGSLLVKNNDIYRDDVVLFVKGDGLNGATSFVDSSPVLNVIQTVNNPIISADRFVYGGSSVRFFSTNSNTVPDMLRVDSSTINIFSGEFTVEMFFNCVSDIQFSRLCNWNRTWSDTASIVLGIFPDTKRIFFSSFLKGNPIVAATTPLVFDSWHHIAVTRDSLGFVRLFFDGILEGTSQVVGDLANSPPSPYLTIGGGAISVGGFSPFNGYIDSFCLTKKCRYTSNFQPYSQKHLR